MFVCFVSVGNACQMSLPDQSLRLPPLINPHEKDAVERYDSVINQKGDHTVIYSNGK
jgi:hypothetical protein